MDLFKKKCQYCRNKIDKGKEIKKDVKIPGLLGTHPKNFCSEKHYDNYEKEVEEHLKNSKTIGSCCG